MKTNTKIIKINIYIIFAKFATNHKIPDIWWYIKFIDFD